MSDLRNPFTPSRGARPPVLAGRQALLAAARACLDDVEAGRPAGLPVFAGVGGSGKTVLLHDVLRAAHGRGWYVGRATPRHAHSGRAAVAAALASALGALQSARPRDDGVRELGEALAAFHPPCRELLPVLPPPGAVNQGPLLSDIVALLQRAAETVRDAGGCGFVALIDDAHALPVDDLAVVVEGASAAVGSGLPVVLLVAGTPSVLQATKDSDVARVVVHPVAPLAEAETADAVRGGFARVESTVADEAIHKIHAISGGNPLVVQHLGYAAFGESSGSHAVTLDTVAAAVPLAQAEYESGFLAPRFTALSAPTRRFLLAVADADPPVRLHRLAADRVDGSRRAGNGGVPSDELLRSGFLFSVDGDTLQFSYPGARRFLRRTRAS